MRILSLTALSLLATSFSSPGLAGPSGPDDRQVTDPHSLMSASNAAAHALSIDDLNSYERHLVHEVVARDRVSRSDVAGFY